MLLPTLAVLVQPWLKPELQKMLCIIQKKMEHNEDNDSPPAKVPGCHPGMWWQHDYSDSQGDAGGYQYCVCNTSKEAPKPIPSRLHEGGGPASKLEDEKW